MNSIPARELRNNTAAILRRVEAGEVVDVLRNDQPIARIIPLRGRPTWRPAADVVRELAAHGPPDPTLRAQLAELAEQTTDDVGRP